MCDYKTIDEKITELAEINSLNVIKGYAEMGDVEGVLKEADLPSTGCEDSFFPGREMFLIQSSLLRSSARLTVSPNVHLIFC